MTTICRFDRTGVPEIDAYIDLIEEDPFMHCIEQEQGIKLLCKALRTETLRVDVEQLDKYMGLEKYFPYRLFPWEKFCFAIHNCIYREDGQLRWPELLIFVGRGSGKNGYLAFEDFALTTPINGVKNYNIDIFANSEDQAKTTFEDIYSVIEDNPKLLQKFEITKERIVNIKTKSVIRFRTSGLKTKDGGRPGKVDFDEYHAYENNRMIDVAKTGLGKKAFPRSTIITTNGDVRGGPLDHLIDRAVKILQGVLPDNGLYPFICRLANVEQIENENAWHMANPSLRYFPVLLDEMRREYSDFLMDRIGNISFAQKRMNLIMGDEETEVTSWKNILATNQEIPDLTGKSCIAAVDFAKTSDFVAAGLLFEVEDKWFWITHTWVCKQNKEQIARIKFPLREAEARGLLTFVDDVEIPPDAPAQWLADQSENYNICGLAIDSFRYALMKKALASVGFDTDKNGRNNIKLIRPSHIMQIAPLVASKFAKHLIVYGDNMLMRWYTNNAKQILDNKGNITYGKIEPKSRKTDGFMAFVAAVCRILEIEGYNDYTEEDWDDEIYVYG